MSHDYIIHVVDDEEPVRHSLAFLLSTFGYQAKTYPTPAAFLEVADGLSRACLITDLRMPGMTGIDLLRSLREGGNMMPVIIVTGHGDVQAAVAAMKAGASDFLEKPFTDQALIAAITRSHNHADAESELEQARTAARKKLEMLSTRERQVLDGIIEGLPTKVIAHDLGLSPRTVEVYRANLMAKMHARNLAELIRMTVTTD